MYRRTNSVTDAVDKLSLPEKVIFLLVFLSMERRYSLDCSTGAERLKMAGEEEEEEKNT